MIRVFLDANILFSAAFREASGLMLLWSKKGVHLVTSSYALREAERNITLKRPIASDRLRVLISQVEVTNVLNPMDNDYGLPPKDQPILAAALASGCAALLTGDIADFGHLMGQSIQGTQVMTVSMFLTGYPDIE